MLATSPARWLNVRTLWAQTPVSMLGKMLSTTRWPARSAEESSDMSPLVRVNDGAALPTAGSSPEVWMGLPRKVIVAMRTGLADRIALNGG